MGESIKSKYHPSNPNKYKGNPNNIICRSNPVTFPGIPKSAYFKFCHSLLLS